MNIVLTNWRGVFTSEHPTFVTVPRAYDPQYKNLALMALLQAPYIHAQNIPDTKRPAWRILAQIAPKQHFPYAAALLQHPTQAQNILLMSGDAREVLHHCMLASNIRHAFQKDIVAIEDSGMLAIGIAVKHMNASHVAQADIHSMSCIGFAHVAFTPTPHAYSIVRKLHNKNICVKIVSPMPLRVSQAIARSVGIIASNDVCITGADLISMSDGELREHVAHVNIFSELEFADELRIARVFEDAGHRILHHEFSGH